MFYVGIDLGGTNIAAGVVDEDGRIILKDSVPTGADRPYQLIIKDMAMLVQKILKDADIDIKDIKSIGIGCPGSTNDKEGIFIFANNIPTFTNIPLRAEIQKYINVPVKLNNDAACAALAESIAGASAGAQHSITITLGTGVGGGVVIYGKIYQGFNFSASEVGHMVIKSNGEKCNCGRKGCWEMYASATGLIHQTKEAASSNKDSLINKLIEGDLSRISARTAFDAAKKGDEIALKVVSQYISYIAEGLINVINIFAPEVVVIGGGISKEGEYLLRPLRELVFKDVYFKEEPQTQIRVAKMGNDAGIIGAAMLGKENA